MMYNITIYVTFTELIVMNGQKLITNKMTDFFVIGDLQYFSIFLSLCFKLHLSILMFVDCTKSSCFPSVINNSEDTLLGK